MSSPYLSDAIFRIAPKSVCESHSEKCPGRPHQAGMTFKGSQYNDICMIYPLKIVLDKLFQICYLYTRTRRLLCCQHRSVGRAKRAQQKVDNLFVSDHFPLCESHSGIIIPPAGSHGASIPIPGAYPNSCWASTNSYSSLPGHQSLAEGADTGDLLLLSSLI